MVLDIKMKDFRCKTRIVAGGQMIKTLATIIYASAVSSKTVTIALMVAALNDLEVKSDGILNAYVQLLLIEKI